MKKKIVNPHWTNNARTVLSAEFHYEDGRVMQATITDIAAGNPDWDQIKSEFTAEEIEANTGAAMTKQAKTQAQEKARAEADKIRKENEVLFDAKLKAFELDAVKDSKDRKTKAKLRRAKNVYEINAFVTKIILDMDALADAEVDAAPAAE
jgi:hypothetical protein